VKKNIILSAVGLLWFLTLGVTYFDTVYTSSCDGCEGTGQPGVYAFVDVDTRMIGIPFFLGWYTDILPYSLRVAVTVDQKLSGQTAIIESMEIEYSDGNIVSVIQPEHVLKETFVPYNPYDKLAGKIYRRATINIDDVIKQRDAFVLIIKGYIQDYASDKDLAFERELHIRHLRHTRLSTGWEMLIGLGV
jgi:hypothetical protein